MLFLIFYFSLFSSLVILLFGSSLGSKGSWSFSVFSTSVSWVYMACLFWNFFSEEKPMGLLRCGSWFKVGSYLVNWELLMDGLSTTMCFMVITVSLLVQMFSYSYMFSDPSLPSFFAYLLLFTFFMLVLVTASNFVVLFLGWEGVGFCSFLLINFWNTSVGALKAAMKALAVNRVGDFFLLAGIALLYAEFKTSSFLPMFNLTPYLLGAVWKMTYLNIELDAISVMCFFLLVGCFGKSAQLGMHVWLPDAMEGPTPVSALMHAATMVTAGVFLVVSCSPIFEYAPSVLKFMLLVGSLTSVFSALCGVVENDAKSMIAHSTCSQLGFMFFVCGMSGYDMGIFHLFNHAFFKALLFLAVGSLMHAASNEQNISFLGGLSAVLPLTSSSMLIGLMSLSAFPYSSGFYSKELILSSAVVSGGGFGFFAYWLGLLTSFLTAFYSYRLFFYVFIEATNMCKPTVLGLKEENIFICFPLLVLGGLSVFSGYFLKQAFVGPGSNFFDYVYILPENLKTMNAEFVPFYLKNLPLAYSFLGWGCFSPQSADNLLKFHYAGVYNLFKSSCFFNFFYSKAFNNLYSFFFYVFYYNLTEGFYFFGPKGATWAIWSLSGGATSKHTGLIYQYLCFFTTCITWFMMFYGL